MPKLWCSSCGGSTDWSSAKPNFCSFCSEPFVKKAAVAAAKPIGKPVSTGATRRDSIAERVQQMEEAQDDIPLTFDIKAVGAKGVGNSALGQIIKVDGDFVKAPPSFDRGGGGGDDDGELAKVRQAALKKMLDPTPHR